MGDEEKKLYFIMHSHLRKMAEDYKSQRSQGDLDQFVAYMGMPFSSQDWRQFVAGWETHVCRVLGARMTSVRKDTANNFYINKPTPTALSLKPDCYFEIGRDVGLKILALEHMP